MSTENKVRIPANMTELPDDIITTETLDGTITSWNKGVEQIHGYSVKEILGKPMSILEPSILFGEIKELTELIKQGDRIHYHETLQIRKDGKIIDVSQTISTIFDTSENPIAVLVIVKDRKSFEEKKKFQVEFRFRRKDGSYIYAENSGAWLKNNGGAFRDSMEYVKPCRDMQSHRVFKDITDWKLSIKKLEKSEKKSRSFRQNFYCSIFQLDENFFSEPLHGFVEEITVHSGTESIYRIKWREIIHPDDLFLKSEFYSGTIYDATEGKETEKYLANIETARKREIHRIKNNLQVISSLLHLQAEKFSNRECIKDSEILAAFRERQDRIIPLAHIHEKLHKGNELNRFDFFSYIEELTDNLFLTYRLESTYANLNVDLEKHIFFDMNAAVPSGMNVNELISNSLKDAFFSHISRDILFGQNL